jgi:hypothetical protein
VVERAAMMCVGEEIGLCDLPAEFAAPVVAVEGEGPKPAAKKKK